MLITAHRRNLLKCFTTPELMRWPGIEALYGPLLRATPTFAPGTDGDYRWEELHKRYHDAMRECHEHEGQLTEEWTQLMNVERFTFLIVFEVLIKCAVLPHLG